MTKEPLNIIMRYKAERTTIEEAAAEIDAYAAAERTKRLQAEHERDVAIEQLAARMAMIDTPVSEGSQPMTKPIDLLRELRPSLAPRAEHICGTPDAMCDMDCVERAYQHEQDTAPATMDQLVQYLRVSADLADSVTPRDGVAYVPTSSLRRAIEFLVSPCLTIEFKPLLVSGCFRVGPRGYVILIDSEQSPGQQITTLWHEVLHLVLAALGKAHDENWIETMALRFAAACPDLLIQPRATENREAPHG